MNVADVNVSMECALIPLARWGGVADVEASSCNVGDNLISSLSCWVVDIYWVFRYWHGDYVVRIRGMFAVDLVTYVAATPGWFPVDYVMGVPW